MLFCHEGNPGSGKSYDIQVRIVDQLAAGRKVYTNIDGHDDQNCRQAIAELSGLTRRQLDEKLIFLTDDQVGKFWEIAEPGSFIVIDEIHKWFNSRDWSGERNRAFADWCSTHRHQGYDLCMITQRINKVDRQASSMVEWRYFYRRLNFFGSLFKNGYLIYVYSGDDPKPIKQPTKCTYDVRYFKCYHSYKGNVIEKKVVKNVNLLRHPIFYALALCVVLVGYFFSKSSFRHGDILGVGATTKKIEEAAAAVQGVQATPTGPAHQIAAAAAPASAGSAAPIWLPVSMYLTTSDGREFVHVGRYRLENWLTISEDKRLVLVSPIGLPPQVLETPSPTWHAL